LTYAVTDGVTDEVFHPWPTWPPQSATRADRLTTRVEPSTTEADPMPAWTITDARTGMAEVIEADRIEDDGNGWSWWLVVVIVNRPRWACIRRVAASDVAGEPVRIGGQPWTPG